MELVQNNQLHPSPFPSVLPFLSFTQLFLPEKKTEPYRHGQLEKQRDPKPCRGQPFSRIDAEIRKHAPGANFVRRRGSPDYCCQGAEHLRGE